MATLGKKRKVLGCLCVRTSLTFYVQFRNKTGVYVQGELFCNETKKWQHAKNLDSGSFW